MTTAAPVSHDTPQSILYAGHRLTAGQGLTSGDGRFNLTVQSDGNVVLYDPYSRPLWATKTDYHPSGVQLVLEIDGNLALYQNDPVAIWTSGTHGVGPSPFLLMQNDGNLAMYTGQQPYWATSTDVPTFRNHPTRGNSLNVDEGLGIGDSLISTNGAFRLTLEIDGNLVEYNQSTGSAVWTSNTAKSLGWCLIMQEDGNLVLYDAHKAPIWASGTSGHNGAGMTLEDDGGIMIIMLQAAGETQHLWTSGAKEVSK